MSLALTRDRSYAQDGDSPVFPVRSTLPHPRFRGGMPSSPSPYKGEGKAPCTGEEGFRL